MAQEKSTKSAQKDGSRDDELEMFRSLLDKSSDAIEVIDQATLRYLDVNETACRSLGYTRDELLSMRVPDIDRSLDRSQWKKLGDDLQTQSSVTIESTHRRKDGSEFPVEVSVSLVRFDGRDLRIAVVRDISGRKADEANLKVFRALLDKANDAIEVIDPDTLRYIDANETACRSLGYSRDELLGMRIADIHVGLEALPLQQIGDDLRTGRPVIFEAVHRRKDGSTFPVEVSISQVRIDRAYNIAVARDISERKAFENNLRLFRALLDQASDVVEMVDTDTLRYLDVNEAASRMYGYSREELLAMHVHDIDPDINPDQIEKVNEQLRRTRSATLESVHRRKDGSTFPAEINISLVRIADKDYRLAVVRDITERKRAEDILRQRESQLEEAQRIGHLGHWEWSVTDNRGTCSDEVYRIFGREPGTVAFTIEGFLRSLHADDRARAREVLHGATNATSPTEADFRIVTPGEEIRWVHIKSNMQKDGHGKPSYIFGTCQDITERKLTEEALHRTNRALKLLSECNAMLVHAEAEQPFLEDVCRLAVETGGYLMAWVGLAENDPDRTVRPIAVSGYEEGYLDGARISWAETELGQGPTGTAIRTGKAVICTQSATDPKLAPWREGILKRGYRSSIALPLSSRHQVFGALTIYAAEPNAFSDREVELLQELANQVSYGTETIRTRAEHEQHAAVLRQSLEQSIQAIADTVEARDPYTAGHQRNVADLAAAIANELKLAEDQIQGIRLAAIIHDLGKIHIPAEILSKPAKLTDIEYQMMQMHPQAGYDIVKSIEFPWPIAQMVLQHHERLDGSGYPQGLKGDQILPESRILAVADVVEAMSSHRPYRGGLGLEAALHEVTQHRGVLYDPAAVDACIRLFRELGYRFPVNVLER